MKPDRHFDEIIDANVDRESLLLAGPAMRRKDAVGSINDAAEARGMVYTTLPDPATQANVVTTVFCDRAINCSEYKVTEYRPSSPALFAASASCR